ncbi:MAG: hypothetical protein HY713_08600 [candidate division NC10 bacterium]|nr:hypothetical protein [candidate division NC10 bacterium]
MDPTANQSGSPRDPLELLNSVKNRFTPADREAKIESLRSLRGREIRDVPSLIRLHESLCFLRAYPDAPDVLRLVEEALGGFAARVDLLKSSGRPSELKKLRDTGIVHTTVYYPFPHVIAKWLVAHFPGDVELDWEDDAGIDRIRAMLPFAVAYAENDALDDEGISWRDWVTAAKGKREVSDLLWLLERLDRATLPPEVLRTMYDGAELLLGWELRDPAASRTLAKFPTGRIFYHRGPLLRGQMDFWGAVQKPLPALRPDPPQTAEALIHLFRAALSARSRELHPLLHANPQDVLVADVGRGLRIVLVGVLPEFRLPLEGYYCFLVLKNGVPVSYGGGGPLLDRLEIAGNIFESFRQGESVYIFSQVFRVFHHLCGSQVFLVPRYQVGYENEEALQSGAFWFYHKLGFRPEDPDVLKLSEEEQDKIKADPTYRSSRATLERLAQSDLSFGLAPGGRLAGQVLQPGRLGLLVTQRMEQRFSGDRSTATRTLTRNVVRILGIPGWEGWPTAERSALERLAPLLVLIPDLNRWRAAEKRALLRIIQAKGGRRESEYIRLLREHPRLGRSLCDLAATASLAASPSPTTSG